MFPGCMMISGGVAAPYAPAQSLEFKAASSQYLSFTNAGASTDRTKAFVSKWIKRAALTGRYTLFSINSGGTVGAANQLAIGFENAGINGDFLNYNEGTTNVVSTRVFRDPLAHLHLYIEWNTNEAVAADRVKAWINGVQMTDWAAGALFGTLGMATPFGQASVAQNIGRRSDSNFPFDGVLSDIAWGVGVDAPGVGAFGEFNAYGQWVPKRPSVTNWGTNGFWLDGEMSGTTVLDKSGNGNNWTAVNGVTTTSDVPGDKASANLGNYARWNELDKSSGATLSLAGTRAAANTTGYRRGKATFGVESGKWVWACKLTYIANHDYVIAGIANSAFDVGANAPLGEAATSYGFMSEYKRTANSNTALSTLGFVNGDFVAVAFDADEGKIWFGRIPGAGGTITWYESGDPAAGTGEQFASIPAGLWTPAYSVAASSSYQCTLHTDLSELGATPPTGFKPLCTAHLPTKTPKNPGAHMQVVTAAAASLQTAIDALPFTSDLIIAKDRNNATDWVWRDSARGVGNKLASNSTAAESAFSGYTGGDWVATCIGGLTHMTGPEIAALVTATGATITPFAIAYDATLGFAIITFNGTGVGGDTFPHPLGQAPAMAILKNRETAGYQWPVYHEAVGAGAAMFLNDVVAKNTNVVWWNNTAPTASLFTLGSSGNTNSASNQYVAYLFANTDAIKVGSYIGNGNADGPFIDLGGHPLLMMRKSLAGYNWAMQDFVRAPENPVARRLFANLPDAEYTNADVLVDFVAPGAKVRGADNNQNVNGVTYIYLAFLDQYFGGKKLAQGRAR